MDQAVTRAAFAMPTTTPPAAAPRLVGEFEGFIDGKPSVVWADRARMPNVGEKLYAGMAPAVGAGGYALTEERIEQEWNALDGFKMNAGQCMADWDRARRVAFARAIERALAGPAGVAPRAWSILLTSANHGTVGPLGSTFPHAGEHHERVVVVEVPAAAGAPSDQVNLVLRDASAAEAGAGNVPRDERAAFERHERASNLRRVGVDRDGSGGWYENPCVQSAWEGRRARAEVAAQAGQVAVPEDRQALVNEALSAARELGDREYAHAHSLGKGGPGVKAKVFAAEKRVLAAINALAAPAQAKPLPAAEVPLWDENGEPWNLAAEQIEYERAQASTAGERSQEGGAA